MNMSMILSMEKVTGRVGHLESGSRYSNRRHEVTGRVGHLENAIERPRV